MDDLPILQVRQIEANIIKPIYQEMVAELGEDRAREILTTAINKDAIRQGAALAASTDQPNDLETFTTLMGRWSTGDALTKEELHASKHQLDFNVTRCRYAEAYADMGLSHIGSILSCGRDGSLCEGYNPDVTLTRTQTIMGGASHCDFRFKISKEG
ncbi:MAG: L-2-amino-thiazoline-4-carboxylic acid hydrolase [Alphaproteobacteria bacterium]|jgi:plasmid stability protein|nr:L-2-amino-thiazoline-4-carboxylic acid hydrolase [Alphaproteobacteria bacterium]|tara:strand:+ start:135 stop:605 length:471 start_codon:yes stop_codon:yes gene_type:complete